MATKDEFARVAKRIDSMIPEMIELQRALTAVPALGPENGGEGEEKKAKVLREALGRMGFLDIEEVKAPDDRVPCGYRPNLILRSPGKRDRRVWCMAHVDIVPPGEESLWETPPYEVVEKDGKLFGRGVEDNQQGLVTSLFGLKAIIDEGLTPEYSVGLVFVADEETGSKYGLGYVIRETDYFSPQDIIIVPDYGNPEGTDIEISEKSALWARFTVRGEQCHASRPNLGNNALRAGAALITRLDALAERFSEREPLFVPDSSTFEPTKKLANVPNVNTIPGEDVFYFDCRVLPQYELDDVVAEMRRIGSEIEETYGVKVIVDPEKAQKAAPPTPVDAPVVKALGCAIGEVVGKEARQIGIGGGTVAAFFRKAGYPAAVWSSLDETAHSPNEYCKIDNLVQDAKVFAHVYLGMCGEL